MKVAVPVSEGLLSPHFGHCQVFTVFAIDPDNQQILESETLTPPPHEPGLFPKWLGEMGVDLVLAGGLGPKAQSLLSEQGIDAIAGCPALEPKTVVQQYLSGSLSTGKNACDH